MIASRADIVRNTIDLQGDYVKVCHLWDSLMVYVTDKLKWVNLSYF